MAEFEELRLTVNLVDNASTGLAKIRTELVGLTQTAGQMTTSFTRATQSATELGSAAGNITPKLQRVNDQLKALERSATDAGKSLVSMAGAAGQGLSGLPRMATGLWEARDAVQALGQSLEKMAPAAAASITSLAGVAIGVAAVGLAVVAYGVSVFRFAKEMDQLGRTARALGMSFAELKSAQDQAKAFGHSAESITRSFQGIQDAQFDLYKNNSQLRQKLLAQGVDANWVNQLAAAEPGKAREMIARYGEALRKQAIDAGWGKAAAAALRNQFYGDLGQKPEDMELVLKPVSPERAAEMQRVADLSKNVSEVWGEIVLKMQSITLPILSAGLPYLLDALNLADSLFTGIGFTVGLIETGLNQLKDNLLFVLKGIPGVDLILKFIEGFNSNGADPSRPSVPGVGTPPATPQSYTPEGENNPLLNRASFSTDELVDETGQNTAQSEKLTGQLARLNDYFDRQETRSTGSQGGGVQKASYSPSGGSSGMGSAGSGNAGVSTAGGGGGAQPQTGAAPSGSTTAAPSGSGSSSGGKTTAAPSGGGAATSSGGSTTAAPSGPAWGSGATESGGGKDAAPFSGSMKDRLSGLKSVMSEVSEAGMTTTSGYRDPGHGLSRANPRSAHVQALAFDTRARTGAQVDAAMTKQREIFASRGMVEGRDYKFIDEVRKPSGHATGPHLHTQLTPQGMKVYAQSKAAEQSTVAGVTGNMQPTLDYKSAGQNSSLLLGLQTPGKGDTAEAFNLDRAALDRSALSDATQVRADGTVKVDVSRGPTKAAAAKQNLFVNTEMQKSEAGQLTQHGPKVYDTADNYLYQNI